VSDFYIDLAGDLRITGNGDIALTQSPGEKDIQQVYLRLMTEPGDFYIYPNLGTDLSMLYGMPQTPETGDFGKRLIRAALERENIFGNRQISIEAVPTSADSIRFDVFIVSDFRISPYCTLQNTNPNS
jgi:hypothetical protein